MTLLSLSCAVAWALFAGAVVYIAGLHSELSRAWDMNNTLSRWHEERLRRPSPAPPPLPPLPVPAEIAERNGSGYLPRFSIWDEPVRLKGRRG